MSPLDAAAVTALNEQQLATARGRILYDPSRVRKPAPELFSVDFWRARDAVREMRGGRGSVACIEADGERWVLRHYRRGGLVARIARDSYVWVGADRTRAFAEWRLLAELYRRGLPVPRPVAAQYVRRGVLYRADLITEQLVGVSTLADAITGQALSADRWQAIGRTIAAFHRHGVQHADLNAHNILVGEASVHLLDFDRGRIRQRGDWEHEVIERLHRSLRKIAAERGDVAFGERQWRWLCEGLEVNSD